MSIYFASVPLQPGKHVSSVTLPVLSNAGGTTAMHIFSMATGTGTPTTGAPYSSLAAAYDNVGITDNADPAAGDFDGTGETFSAQALAAGTPTPLTAGGQATFGGTTFTWPTAVGTPDDVIADGQTIDLSGSGTDLGFLGAGSVRGGQRDRDDHLHRRQHPVLQPGHGGLVQQRPGGRRRDRHHHDELELLQQHADHPPGEHLLRVGAAAGRQDRGIGHAADGERERGNGITALHVFAMAIGSGTPTSG